MKNCNCHYEMPRDGSGQLGRYLNALDPSYAPIDGRSLEDLLVFAKRYAAQIRFYDIPESKIDDDIAPEHVSWREFFRRDMAVIAASISVVDLARLKRDYDQNREHLDSYPDSDALNDLFDPILGMIAQIDRWYSLAIPENPLHADLQLAIDSLLRDQVKKTAAYEEGYKYLDPKHPLQLDYSAIENDSLWGLDEEVNPDASIYQGANLDDQIRYAALFVDEIFHAVYGVMTDLVEVKSLGYMNFALQAYPSHQPHMALFIAFLELFRLAQQQMNGLTGKMLDFYYQDVLRLAVKPSISDRAYVVFELAKDVAQYDIAQGSALKAGKDLAGKEQIYVTNTDLVVNQAKVKELKTLFIQKSPSAASVNGTVDAIFARPVANSLDGYGEKITDPSGKWPTFGKGMPKLQKAKNICQKIEQYKETLSRKDQAKIGFAVASPQLLLQGGNRLVEWHIDQLSELLPETDEGETPHQVEIWLSGEKDWLVLSPLEEDVFSVIKQMVTTYGIFPLANAATKSGYFIDREANSFYIYLPPAEDAVIPFDAKLHVGYPYLTSYPVAQIMLGPNLVFDYALFRAISFSGQSISARVGSIVPAQTVVDKFLEEHHISESLLGSFLYDGLKKLVLQNETGLLPANKPFDPFTLYPGFGKSFYVGSDEIFNKPLSKLAIHIKNTRDPEVVDDESGPVITLNIAGSAASASTNRDFKYSVSLLADKHWDQLYTEEPSWSFFRYQLAQNLLNHAVVKENGSPGVSPFTTERKPLQAVTEFKPETVKGFIRISNLKEIPTNGNIPAIQLSQEMAPKLQIKEISASYHSELTALDPEIDQFFHVYPFGVTEVFVGDVGRFTLETVDAVTSLSINVVSNLGSRQSGLFNRLDKSKDYLLVNADGALLPQFGYLSPNAVYERAYPSQVGQVPIKQRPVKEFASKGIMETLILEASGIRQALQGGNNQYSGDGDLQEGMLFIGLEKLKSLDTLSLLFQFAEGSAADEDNETPEIHWSYLTYNEWRPLKGENLISDGTYGFKTTGIIKIEVPQDSTDHNTIITDGLRWFCASVTEHADRIPMLVNVVAQAVETQFQDNANDQSHFDTALPAGSISKLAVAVAQVGKVEQPFASFDGKHREIGKEFYTRVSERLRHKARAITPWDYEHLVLDRFPSIYKVKCITHTDPNCLCRQPIPRPSASGESRVTCCGPQMAPGHVLIVPIANLKNRNAANPLQPKTSRRTLLEIEDYLSKRTSPFVKVHAKNPVYEQVLVFFRVQFVAGADKGYYLKKLNDEIVNYLTPWAFDEDADVSFAQKIYASAVINFIEERSYVDFITDFLMFVCSDECCLEETVSVGNAAAGKSEKLADILAHISGCCDLEQIFANAPISLGKVIAEPSTSRSILVSYPRHIIIPYEAPVEESACEARKKSRAQVVAVGDRPLVEDTGNRIRLEAKARKPRRNR